MIIDPIAPGPLTELVGIIELEPCGNAVVHGDWTTIGSVVIAQGHEIEVAPRRGIDTSQRSQLDMAATQAWLYGLAALMGWRYQSDVGYVTGVEVRRADRARDFRCAAAISSRCSSDSATPRTSSGSSVPSGR
jgi:hypothetical protein